MTVNIKIPDRPHATYLNELVTGDFFLSDLDITVTPNARTLAEPRLYVVVAVNDEYAALTGTTSTIYDFQSKVLATLIFPKENVPVEKVNVNMDVLRPMHAWL